MQEQARFRIVRVAVQVLDPVGIEGRGAAHDAVHLVSLCKQQLGQKRAVLAGDPRYQSSLHALFSCMPDLKQYRLSRPGDKSPSGQAARFR